jgi:hypothetical protein
MFKQVIGVRVKEGPLIVPCTDGLNNRLDFGYTRLLFGKPEGSSLASHVRKKVTVFLLDRFDEREQCTVRNASNAR